MADVIKTIGATGADYTTLAAFWTARNTNAGAGDVYIAELIDAADYPWGDVTGTFAGSVIVRAATAVKLDLANPSAAHARIYALTGSALFWRPLAPITIEDVEIYTENTTSTSLRLGAFEGTNFTGRRLWVRGGTIALSHGRATALTLIENSIITEGSTWGVNNGFAGLTIRNSVIANNNTSNTVSRGGIRKDVAGTVIENIVSFNNLRSDFFGASTTATVGYLASGDATATGANALTGVTSAAFTNYAANVLTAAGGGVLDSTAAGGADRGLNLSAADIIAINSPYDWQFFARNKLTNTGSIAITGTYSGGTVPTSIEARWSGGPWVVIDAAPSGGTFSGALSGLASGNGALEVRYSNATSVTDSVDSVAIGSKLLFWGQSNFSGRANNAQAYTGTAGFFHKYTVTNNLWQQGADPFDTDTASGSLFPLLANQLVSAIGCPVAFIGVAAGSTTLAQWQPGQTLNTRMLSYISAAASDGLEGICSWIGESDASAATPETDFKNRYNAVIDQLEALTGTKNMLVAISGLSLTDYANVRQWINDIASTNPNASTTVPQIWPLYQKIHYETDTETALAADAVGDGIIASFYTVAGTVTAHPAFTMPQFLTAVSGGVAVPVFTASASATMPQMSAAISGSVVISGSAASLSFAMPQMAVAGAATDTAPSFAASIAATMPQIQVQCQALSVASGVIASINMAMPQMSVAALGSDTSPAISASASFTMPQFSVYAVSGGFSFYSSIGTNIETVAASTHLEYTL